MTGAEARKLKKEELNSEITRLRAELFKTRTQATTEKVEDTSQFRKLRKDIARLLTERSARHVAATDGNTAAKAEAPAKPAAKPAKAAKPAAPKAAKPAKAAKSKAAAR